MSMGNIVKEFREFALKGNVVDLAVAVVIGAAFGKIVSSLVNDIIMPLLGTLLGGVNFTGLAVQIGNARIQYGNFIQTCVDFLIIAWAIFVAVKLMNRFKRAEPPAAPPTPPREEQLLVEIRDLLKQRV